MITFLLFVIATASCVIAMLLTGLWRQGLRIERVIEVQLNGIDETHKLGYAGLQAEIDRIEVRVRSLEHFYPPIQPYPLPETRQ